MFPFPPALHGRENSEKDPHWPSPSYSPLLLYSVGGESVNAMRHCSHNYVTLYGRRGSQKGNKDPKTCCWFEGEGDLMTGNITALRSWEWPQAASHRKWDGSPTIATNCILQTTWISASRFSPRASRESPTWLTPWVQPWASTQSLDELHLWSCELINECLCNLLHSKEN